MLQKQANSNFVVKSLIKSGDVVKIPKHLKIEDGEVKEHLSKIHPSRCSVWHQLKLVALAKRDIIQAASLLANDVTTFTKESLLDLLLERREVNISEFELLKFVVTWCRYTGGDVNSFTDYIEFGKFNIEQVCTIRFQQDLA